MHENIQEYSALLLASLVLYHNFGTEYRSLGAMLEYVGLSHLRGFGLDDDSANAMIANHVQVFAVWFCVFVSNATRCHTYHCCYCEFASCAVGNVIFIATMKRTCCPVGSMLGDHTLLYTTHTWCPQCNLRVVEKCWYSTPCIECRVDVGAREVQQR